MNNYYYFSRDTGWGDTLWHLTNALMYCEQNNKGILIDMRGHWASKGDNNLFPEYFYGIDTDIEVIVNEDYIDQLKKDSEQHSDSRLVIKNEHLFITAGERGQGMIAQDYTKHPGSIIRINLDGTIPKDNPKFINKQNWLPEIYQIGVRNPQGMYLSPFDEKIYLTNHGAKGGDWFGTANFGENYGWKILGWGGTNYSGTKIGPKWKPGYTKAIKYWVPSIAVSAITIYQGETFKEWNGEALIASLKDQSLRKIRFNKSDFISEEIIFKGNIGRIRDIKIHKSGDLYMLSDKGELWRMYK